MPYANIDATVSGAALREIAAAIATIEAALPFLVLLSAEERKSLFKMGDKSVAFVEEALMAARNYPEAIPQALDVSAFEKDLALAKQLGEIEMLLTTLLAKVSDTRIAAGSEAISSAAQVYQQFKASGRTEPGLKSVNAGLSERWKQARIRAKPGATTPE
jgi:hypothetical protein